jgi:hypothetical protein
MSWGSEEASLERETNAVKSPIRTGEQKQGRLRLMQSKARSTGCSISVFIKRNTRKKKKRMICADIIRQFNKGSLRRDNDQKL